jgi:hypothetical protein
MPPTPRRTIPTFSSVTPTTTGQRAAPLVRVNDDTTSNSQFWPRLKADPTSGTVAVSWYDAQNDTGSGPGDTDGTANDDTEFFATIGSDGEVTFDPNQQIVPKPSSAVANPNNGNDYGDYSGLAFYGGGFYPAWADNSNSTGNNPDGTLHGFDVYTAKLSLPSPPPPGSPPPPVSSPAGSAGGGTSGTGGGLGNGTPDRFEPNNTSDQAAGMGRVDSATQTIAGLSIDRHASGFFDQD